MLTSIKKVFILMISSQLFFVAFPIAGYSADHQAIQVKGSDTMVNLGQAWAEEFMRQHPDISIAVNGGGSGTGIAAIMAGTTDIAQSSRDMTAEEVKKANDLGHPIEKTIVGYDGIAIIVHNSNPLSQITVEQLSGIYSGKIKNWKEVGGPDMPILALSRERNSGTHVFFLEEILRGGNAKGPEEFAAEVLMMPSSQAIVQEVQNGPSAIGYVGLGYVTKEHKLLKVAKTADGLFLTPSIETVQSKEYPISRALNFYSPSNASEIVRSYIGFVLSDEGQEIVRLLDFVPLEK